MDGMEDLLRKVLIFYAYPGNWAKPFGKISRHPRAVVDSGRLAKAAIKAQTFGAMLCVVCDVLNIALTELGRKTGISDPRIGAIATGTEPTPEESDKLCKELDVLIKSRFAIR